MKDADAQKGAFGDSGSGKMFVLAFWQEHCRHAATHFSEKENCLSQTDKYEETYKTHRHGEQVQVKGRWFSRIEDIELFKVSKEACENTTTV